MSLSQDGLPVIAMDRFATGAELMTFVNQLALQDRPTRYWLVAWITSSSNMLVGVVVITAGFLFRYKKFDETFWIMRFERRASNNAESHNSTPPTQSAVGNRPDNARTASRFVTASTFNCHLLFTSAYAVILFVSIVQAWCTRDYSSSPVIDVIMLDCAMMLALWTKACLGCIGYIELLLPNVNAFVWNSTFAAMWFSTVFVGLWVAAKTALYNSKVVTLRSLIYAQVLQDGLDAAPSDFSVQLTRYAWSHAISQGKWLQLWKGLCGLGAIAQATVYLSIFTLISSKVGRELWQIRARAKYVDANFDATERGKQFEATWWRAQEDRDPSSAPAITSPDCYRPLGLFLLHCLIDHLNITLQSIGIGATSLYMAIRINHDMQTDPTAANQVDYIVSMYGCGIFAILYPINAFNMVFPFIWFPPAKLAAMTQQVLRNRRQRAAHALQTQEQAHSLRAQVSLQNLLRRGDTNESYNDTKGIDTGAAIADKRQSQVYASLTEEIAPDGLRHRSPARQLILDSLVMSHSLPIQGFYCIPPRNLPANAQASVEDEVEMMRSTTPSTFRSSQLHKSAPIARSMSTLDSAGLTSSRWSASPFASPSPIS